MSEFTYRLVLAPTTRRLAVEMGVAALAVVLATMAREALGPVLGARAAFIIYFPVILGVAWYCSIIPTVLSIGLSTLLSIYYFVAPRHSFVIPDPGDQIQAALFLVVSVGIAAGAQAARVSRRRAQYAEELAKRVTDSSGDCIKVLDLHGRLLSMNEGGKRIMDVCDFEAIRGATWIDFWKATAPAEARTAIETALARGTGRFQGLCDTMAGVPKWWDVVVTPILGQDGKIEQILSVSRDISALKASEKVREDHLREIAAHRERLELALTASRMGYWTWDMRSGALTWSDNLEEIHGLPKGSFPGTIDGFNSLIHPDSQSIVREAIQQAIETDQPYDIEFKCVRPDGRALWMRGVGRVFQGSDGKPERMVGVGLDITDRKIGEESLRVYADDLKRSNAELEQFAYIAAHDLQEPVRMIISYLQLIERNSGSLLDAKSKGYMDSVTTSAIRMRQMVTAILEYSCIGKEGVQPSRVSTNTALQAALSNLNGQISASQASIESSELPNVLGIESQIVRLFQNLISNAIKFQPAEPPRIKIAAARDGDIWDFSVEDNGIGIDPQHGRKLFGIFQRLHPKDQYPGTGIGLSACKKIVEQHHGRIWFEPREHGGTTFRFTLSAADG
ncbi:MAG: PAS domain-containing protein [Planctomycetes bacterium]|nr:PAS domain-containing protein [Planctomycetota bacterium]